jgi:hypothetical protein
MSAHTMELPISVLKPPGAMTLQRIPSGIYMNAVFLLNGHSAALEPP